MAFPRANALYGFAIIIGVAIAFLVFLGVAAFIGVVVIVILVILVILVIVSVGTGTAQVIFTVFAMHRRLYGVVVGSSATVASVEVFAIDILVLGKGVLFWTV